MWIPELSAYHYTARAYHPKLGRFMRTDPIGTAGGMKAGATSEARSAEPAPSQANPFR
jgi:RHS repeat-associated protein